MKVALVVAAVCKRESALALLFSFLVMTLIAGSIRPRLDSLAMLLVIEPLSLVKCAVCM
jgi:hypothetical protein